MMWSLMLSVSTLADGDTSMGESLTPPASCDCGTCVNNGAITQANADTDTVVDPDANDPRISAPR